MCSVKWSKSLRSSMGNNSFHAFGRGMMLFSLSTFLVNVAERWAFLRAFAAPGTLPWITSACQ